MGYLSHLDGQSLQRFIDTDLKDFLTRTDDIRKDKDNVRALRSLVENQATPDTLQQNQVLALGPMVDDNAFTHGKTLIDAATKSATSIDEILENQQRLWQDIDRDFRETLKIMGNTQHDNITEINAEKLLGLFEDVDGDMRPSGGSKSSSDS